MVGPRHSPIRLCASIVDRLTFNGTIIETGTDSYRLAKTRARTDEPAKAGWLHRNPTQRAAAMTGRLVLHSARQSALAKGHPVLASRPVEDRIRHGARSVQADQRGRQTASVRPTR